GGDDRQQDERGPAPPGPPVEQGERRANGPHAVRGCTRWAFRTAMARILFVQPSMQPPGGGNGVAAWMLQALADRHRVTVLTCKRWEPEAIDAVFGTRLAGGRRGTHRGGSWWGPRPSAAAGPLAP